jgi:hypothetical protein
MNKITPADISDPQELIARAKELSVELGTPITPGFEVDAVQGLSGDHRGSTRGNMSARPDADQHPARVLIVDDERQNRNVLEVMLALDDREARLQGLGAGAARWRHLGL